MWNKNPFNISLSLICVGIFAGTKLGSAERHVGDTLKADKYFQTNNIQFDQGGWNQVDEREKIIYRLYFPSIVRQPPNLSCPRIPTFGVCDSKGKLHWNICSYNEARFKNPDLQFIKLIAARNFIDNDSTRSQCQILADSVSSKDKVKRAWGLLDVWRKKYTVKPKKPKN